MKYLAWLLKAAIFFTVFAFALNNQNAVQVNLFFGAHWQAPLVLVLLAALALGVLLGMLVMVPLWLNAKRTRKTPTPSPETATASTPDEQVPHGV